MIPEQTSGLSDLMPKKKAAPTAKPAVLFEMLDIIQRWALSTHSKNVGKITVWELFLLCFFFQQPFEKAVHFGHMSLSWDFSTCSGHDNTALRWIGLCNHRRFQNWLWTMSLPHGRVIRQWLQWTTLS